VERAQADRYSRPLGLSAMCSPTTRTMSAASRTLLAIGIVKLPAQAHCDIPYAHRAGMDASIRTGKSPDSRPTRCDATTRWEPHGQNHRPREEKTREKIEDRAAAVCIRWLVMITRAWSLMLTHGIPGIGWQLVA
jgi:hypothetical protein